MNSVQFFRLEGSQNDCQRWACRLYPLVFIVTKRGDLVFICEIWAWTNVQVEKVVRVTTGCTPTHTHTHTHRHARAWWKWQPNMLLLAWECHTIEIVHRSQCYQSSAWEIPSCTSSLSLVQFGLAGSLNPSSNSSTTRKPSSRASIFHTQFCPAT